MIIKEAKIKKYFITKLNVLCVLCLLFNSYSASALNEGPPSFTLKSEPVVQESKIPVVNPFANSNKASLELPNNSLNGESIEIKTIQLETSNSDIQDNLNLEEQEEQEEFDFDKVPQVQNIQVKVKNKNTIIVSFDEIKGVDTYFVLYGTNSVESEDDIYNMPPIDSNSETSVEITDLQDGVDYYFSVVAKANEDYSEFLSDEVSAKIDTSMLTEVKIEKAEALNNILLNVEFSTEMNLKDLKTEDVVLKETFDDSNVKIYKLNILDDKNLQLRTNKLKSGFEYKLEFQNLKSTDNSDLNENSLIFRTSDLESIEDFKIDEITVFDHKGIELSFNDDILNFSELKDNLNIALKSDPNKLVTIQEVLANPTDANKALVVVESLTQDDYQVIIQDTQGIEKGFIMDSNKTMDFQGVNPPKDEEPTKTEDLPDPILKDTTSPADVRNLSARFIDEALETLEITFDPSVDLDNDLEKYELYFATDSDNYFAFTEISKDETDPILVKDLDLNAEYINVKMTAKDINNNESKGAVFKLFLPETGPAGTLALMAMSILGSRTLTRKRKV